MKMIDGKANHKMEVNSNSFAKYLSNNSQKLLATKIQNDMSFGTKL